MPTGLAPAELKKAEPIVYLRISSAEQGRADKGKPPEKQQIFKNQLETVKMYLKKYNLRSVKPENVFLKPGIIDRNGFSDRMGGTCSSYFISRCINVRVHI